MDVPSRGRRQLATGVQAIPAQGVSLRIVLVQPRNPLNILAAARAARNFGLGDIAVVDVYPPAWEEALRKDVDRETPHGPRATSRGWLGDGHELAGAPPRQPWRSD